MQKKIDIRERLTTYLKENALYFKEGREEIDRRNRKIMTIVSLVSFVLIIIFIVITPAIFPEWKATPHYWLTLATMGFFSLYSMLLQKKTEQSHLSVTASAVFLIMALMLGLVAVDVLPYPDSHQVFVSLFMAIFPVLFILPARVIYVLLVVFEVLFGCLVYQVKPQAVANDDFFASLVGLAMGFCLYHKNMALQMRDHILQKKNLGLAQTDGLTGLLNRTTAIGRIERYLGENAARPAVMMLLDVDDFKMVNGRLGHSQGDQVLQQIACILQEMFAEQGIVARMGGDEFMVFIKDMGNEEEVRKQCREINIKAWEMLDKDMHFSCSIGLTMKDRMQPSTFKEMFQMADNALYEAKTDGKGRYRLTRM